MKCPTCGYVMDGATCLYVHGDDRPEPDDIALCVNCGEVLEFGKEFVLQVATLTALMTLSQEQHHHVEIAQKLIRKGDRKS
jgi:hypothetical protein